MEINLVSLLPPSVPKSHIKGLDANYHTLLQNRIVSSLMMVFIFFFTAGRRNNNHRGRGETHRVLQSQVCRHPDRIGGVARAGRQWGGPVGALGSTRLPLWTSKLYVIRLGR